MLVERNTNYMSIVNFIDEDIHYAEKILLGNKTFDINENFLLSKEWISLFLLWLVLEVERQLRLWERL